MNEIDSKVIEFQDFCPIFPRKKHVSLRFRLENRMNLRNISSWIAYGTRESGEHTTKSSERMNEHKQSENKLWIACIFQVKR